MFVDGLDQTGRTATCWVGVAGSQVRLSVNVQGRGGSEKSELLVSREEALALGRWLSTVDRGPRRHLSLPGVVAGVQTIVSVDLAEAELTLEFGPRAAGMLAELLLDAAKEGGIGVRRRFGSPARGRGRHRSAWLRMSLAPACSTMATPSRLTGVCAPGRPRPSTIAHATSVATAAVNP